MARSQAGEEPAQTALGCWQHDPAHSYSNTPVREDCKVLQPSTTSNLKVTTHRGSSSNLPDQIRSHLHLLQVLHHWQQCIHALQDFPPPTPPLCSSCKTSPTSSHFASSTTPLPLAIMVPVSLLVPSPAHHLPTGRSVPLEPPCSSCQGRNLLFNPHMHFILNSKCPIPETLAEVHLSPAVSQLVPCLLCPHSREDLNVTGNTKGWPDNKLMLYLKLECKCYVRYSKYIGAIK